MDEPIPAFVVALERTFDEAMVSNDVARISACVADDWVLVTPEVGPVSRGGLLDAIASGRLTHATIRSSCGPASTATPRS